MPSAVFTISVSCACGNLAHPILHGPHQAFRKKRCQIGSVFIGEIRGAVRKHQERLLLEKLIVISNRQGIQHVVQEGVAHHVDGRRSGIDHHDVRVADIPHVRFASHQRLYIDSELPCARMKNFPKISCGDVNDLSQRLTHIRGRAIVSGLKLAPNLFDLRFPIKRREHRAKTVECHHVGGQLPAPRDTRSEVGSRPGHQSESQKTGKSSAGIAKGVLPVVIAHRFRGGSMERAQTRPQLRQLRNLVRALAFKSRGDQRAHGRKELRIGLRRHRPGLIGLRGNRCRRPENSPANKAQRKEYSPDRDESGRWRTIAELRGDTNLVTPVLVSSASSATPAHSRASNLQGDSRKVKNETLYPHIAVSYLKVET